MTQNKMGQPGTERLEEQRKVLIRIGKGEIVGRKDRRLFIHRPVQNKNNPKERRRQLQGTHHSVRLALFTATLWSV
jgi:hypothetical protein